MDWFSQIRTKIPNFDTARFDEILSLSLQKTEDGHLTMNVVFQYGSSNIVCLEFSDVTSLNLRVAGGMIELGEFFISQEENSFRVWDELIGTSWRCKGINFLSIADMEAQSSPE